MREEITAASSSFLSLFYSSTPKYRDVIMEISHLEEGFGNAKVAQVIVFSCVDVSPISKMKILLTFISARAVV
jgi:DNA-binding transcriptional regulator LsrR (DeoR family)